MSASSCRRLADGLTVGRAVLGLPLILALVAGQGGLAWGLLLLGGFTAFLMHPEKPFEDMPSA